MATVTKFRASDGFELFRVPAGPSADGIVYDGHAIWVANSYAHTITKLALEDGAILNIAGKEWNFTSHVAMVNVVAGEGSGFGMTALYKGFSVTSASNAKALYLQMGMLGSNVTTLNIKDDKLKLLASFPVTGMEEVLEVWKACADKL